jgi:hypothetical protein
MTLGHYRHIDELLQTRNHNGYELLCYTPHIINRDVVYTHLILRKLIGDASFSWANEKSYAHSFGQAQHYENHTFKFERIQDSSITVPPGTYAHLDFNKIPKGIYAYNNVCFANLWLVFDNPTNVKLGELVDHIEFEHGGHLWQRHSTSDIEQEINILSQIFKVDGITYKNRKIYVPLIVPYNVFIFNDTHHGARIRVMKYGKKVDADVYGNVWDANAIPLLAHTNNMTHKCVSVLYRTQFTGVETISTTNVNVKLHFSHPTYAVFIMNISKDRVSTIKLFSDRNIYTGSKTTYEHQLNDIEWFDTYVIVWFNRKFLILEELNTNFNFSPCENAHFMIDNSYSDLHAIEIIAVSFDMMYQGEGMTGLRYSG